MAELSSKKRNALHESSFALPKERKYPIHDEAHAENALARSSGKPEEEAVKAAVYQKYPSMKPVTKDSADEPAILAALQEYEIEEGQSEADGTAPAFVRDDDQWTNALLTAQALATSGKIADDSV